MILVGELRDMETLRIALRAADTGHQVFSTVHSASAPQTIERIIAMFPPAEQKLLLTQLAGNLEAIISQRLVIARDGGRRPATEILRGGPVTQKYILEGRALELGDYMKSAGNGQQTFDQNLLQMFHQELISHAEAIRNATNREALEMAVRGIGDRKSPTEPAGVRPRPGPTRPANLKAMTLRQTRPAGGPERRRLAQSAFPGRVVRIHRRMTQSLPPGQGPVDPRGAFGMPPGPGGGAGRPWPPPGPMMYPPMPPMPPRRRLGAWIIVILLVIALAISVLVNVVQFGAVMAGAAGEVKQTVISGEGPDKIAVVPMDGLIDDDSAQTFNKVLKEVEKDSAVKALVVEIDTPGGSATASDEMYHRLDLFKSDKHVPVVVAMRGMATSGGYYVSCAADYIFAEPGCLTGNIGVLFPRFNVSKLFDKWGVAETTLTATVKGHSYKNAGSMFEPENPQDEAYLQGLVDGTFAQFKSVVQTGGKGS